MATERHSPRRYAILLWALALLFALRVLAQAVQFWAPLHFLPPFDEFQGSNLSYPMLLISQVVILVAMAYFCIRVQASLLLPNRRAGVVLAWLGGIYMAGSVGRLVIGILVPGASSWFTAWISAVFHLVLAAYVLILAVYHLAGFRSPGGAEPP